MARSLEDDIKDNPPCHMRACAIQDCLQKSQYQEDKCENLIDALYECCNEFYKRSGQESTLSCPKVSLLRLKMRQKAQKKI